MSAPADAVRRVLASSDRRSAYPYVVGMAQGVVGAALAALDRGDVASARDELASLLAAVAVLDESADDARRKLAEQDGGSET